MTSYEQIVNWLADNERDIAVDRLIMAICEHQRDQTSMQKERDAELIMKMIRYREEKPIWFIDIDPHEIDACIKLHQTLNALLSKYGVKIQQRERGNKIANLHSGKSLIEALEPMLGEQTRHILVELQLNGFAGNERHAELIYAVCHIHSVLGFPDYGLYAKMTRLINDVFPYRPNTTETAPATAIQP